VHGPGCHNQTQPHSLSTDKGRITYVHLTAAVSLYWPRRMAEGSTLHIKFRTTNGDVGPLSFSDSQTVQQAKEKLWAEWPK
ncbi:ubiquitin-like domain-containing protein, partial [Haematococcus lacustris]